MYRTIVYDNAAPANILKSFASDNEVIALRDAMAEVAFLRQYGKPPKGTYAMRLEKVKG